MIHKSSRHSMVNVLFFISKYSTNYNVVHTDQYVYISKNFNDIVLSDYIYFIDGKTNNLKI